MGVARGTDLNPPKSGSRWGKSLGFQERAARQRASLVAPPLAPLDLARYIQRMPYSSDASSRSHQITLWPHRSLPPEGFAIVISLAFALALLPLLAVLGTPVLWGLLPFAMGALALLWAGLRRSYRDAELSEVLTLSPDRIELVRTNVRGPEQRWEANPYWVRLKLHPQNGPVQNYLTLHGGERDVELGAFLSPEERAGLYDELTRRLDDMRNTVQPGG